jgi:hypothetical protein
MIATKVRSLPGRLVAETERNDIGEAYVGLVIPRTDKRGFPIMISGVDGGGLSVGDWTGAVLADGVTMEVAFTAIRKALTH